MPDNCSKKGFASHPIYSVRLFLKKERLMNTNARRLNFNVSTNNKRSQRPLNKGPHPIMIDVKHAHKLLANFRLNQSEIDLSQ